MNPAHRILTFLAAAGILLVIGIASMLQAAIEQSRRQTAMDHSLSQLAQIEQLQAEAAAADAIVAAWDRAEAALPSWRTLLRELGLDTSVEIRETEQPASRSGWIMRRADLTAASLAPADAQNLLLRMQAAPHPWHLSAATFSAGPDAPAALTARFRLETMVRAP